MPGDITTLRVGDARVSILNAGDLRLRLADELAVPEAEWRASPYADIFDRVGACPSLSVYIELGDVRALVDSNDYRATMASGSENATYYALAGYTPPPSIPTQLASLGVAPEQITHVVITHAHWDHYAGVTTPTESGPAPTYPNAGVWLGAADWQDAEMQTALSDPSSLEARTLGVLQARGLLRLVSGRETLGAGDAGDDGVEILLASGETPGHQIVRLRSRGETLYVIGDLLHHAVEVERPEWMVSWADAASMLATREWFLRDALAERALVVAAHIAEVGRIERAPDNVGGLLRWRVV